MNTETIDNFSVAAVLAALEARNPEASAELKKGIPGGVDSLSTVTPLVFAFLWNQREDERKAGSLPEHVRLLDQTFRSEGPFHFAKKRGLLVRNSGEEFAIGWMTFVNSYTGQSRY